MMQIRSNKAQPPPPPPDVLVNTSVQHKKLQKQMENGIGDLLWTESKKEQTKAMNQLN
jgi:hypothetical protein